VTRCSLPTRARRPRSRRRCSEARSLLGAVATRKVPRALPPDRAARRAAIAGRSASSTASTKRRPRRAPIRRPEGALRRRGSPRRPGRRRRRGRGGTETRGREAPHRRTDPQRWVRSATVAAGARPGSGRGGRRPGEEDPRGQRARRRLRTRSVVMEGIGPRLSSRQCQSRCVPPRAGTRPFAPNYCGAVSGAGSRRMAAGSGGRARGPDAPRGARDPASRQRDPGAPRLRVRREGPTSGA